MENAGSQKNGKLREKNDGVEKAGRKMMEMKTPEGIWWIRKRWMENADRKMMDLETLTGNWWIWKRWQENDGFEKRWKENDEL